MTTPTLSKTLTPLDQISIRNNANYVDVCGVVVDSLPPTMTRTGEFTIKFELVDRSTNRPVTVRFFCKIQRDLPSPAPVVGDVVLLVNVKITMFGSAMILISNPNTRWIVSSPANPGAPHVCRGLKWPCPDDMTYLKGLRTWWRSQNGEIAPRIQNTAVNSAAIAPIPNRQKLSLVRDMVVPPHIPGTIINSNNKYYDMVGRVVKFFPGGASYTVYLTDYTQNIHLFDYNWEEYKRENKTWLGPWGQFTLQVTLWSDNAQHAMKLGVREGDILSMRNMRLKLCDYKETIDGSPIGGTYEGKLHDDKKFPGRPTFTKLNESEPNEYIKQLLQREREYNRRENQLKEKREAGYTEYSQPEDPTLSSPPDPAEDLGENLQIKCGKHATVTTPIGKILNLTPDNRKYQIVCKVVDFMPQDVERFCTLVDTDETPSSSSSSSQCSDQPLQETTAQKWVWRFALLVKGRDGEEMRIIVEGTNAEFLLRLDATDLHKSPETLTTLRNKLSILWGNLEEKKHPVPAQKRKRGGRRNRTSKRSKTGDSTTTTTITTITGKGANSDDEDEADDSMFFDACIEEVEAETADGRPLRLFRLIETTIHGA